jgi:hypothetical protein
MWISKVEEGYTSKFQQRQARRGGTCILLQVGKICGWLLDFKKQYNPNVRIAKATMWGIGHHQGVYPKQSCGHG